MKPTRSVNPFISLYVVAFFQFCVVGINSTGEQLICSTKNETCAVQVGSLKEVIAVLNFTFEYAGAENVTHIRFEDSEIGEVPRLLLERFPNVQVLDLKFCRLKRFRKPLLENSKQLIELDLSYNKLKRLEESAFTGADELQILILFRNDIVEANEKAFTGLGHLQRLVLSSNEVRRIRPGLLKPLTNLTDLDLRKNRLETIENYLQDLVLLEILDLSYNKIKKLESQTFQGLGSLQIVDLSFNRINEIAKDAFKTNANLMAVNLADNKLVVLDLLSPADLFILEISRNQLENLTLEAVKASASRLTISAASNSLRFIDSKVLVNKLNLTYNNLTDLDLLNRNLSILTLDISHNPLNVTKGSLKELPSHLKELVARNISQLSSEAVQSLLMEIPSLEPNVTQLDLSDNVLSAVDWEEFGPLDKVKLLSLFNTNIDSLNGLQKVFPNLALIMISSGNGIFNCTDVDLLYKETDGVCQEE